MHLKTFSSILSVSLVAACATTSRPSAEELKLLDKPPVAVQAKVAKFLPVALAWYQQAERELLPKGRQLTKAEQALARQLGVKRPEKVRVLALETFPLPADKTLRTEAERYGMGSKLEAGRTMGYAILLKTPYADNQQLLAHELVHVQQIERMSSKAFVERYLLEMEMLGYARSPLELEAYSKQNL